MEFFRIERKLIATYVTELIVDENELEYYIDRLEDRYPEIRKANITVDMFYKAYNDEPFEQENLQILYDGGQFTVGLKQIIKEFIDEELTPEINDDLIDDSEVVEGVTDIEE